jgi:hypothetical protein
MAAGDAECLMWLANDKRTIMYVCVSTPQTANYTYDTNHGNELLERDRIRDYSYSPNNSLTSFR